MFYSYNYFFFKQKTAYEMRISDWSSDVCSSDLGFSDEMDVFGLQFGHGVGVGLHERPIISRLNSFDDPIEIKEGMLFRSAERRVGKECVSTCRSRCSPYH